MFSVVISFHRIDWCDDYCLSGPLDLLFIFFYPALCFWDWQWDCLCLGPLALLSTPYYLMISFLILSCLTKFSILLYTSTAKHIHGIFSYSQSYSFLLDWVICLFLFVFLFPLCSVFYSYCMVFLFISGLSWNTCPECIFDLLESEWLH
jgi:hypothetical protein